MTWKPHPCKHCGKTITDTWRKTCSEECSEAYLKEMSERLKKHDPDIFKKLAKITKNMLDEIDAQGPNQ